MGQPKGVDQRNWKLQPSQVPSGHCLGRDMSPCPDSSGAHLMVMVELRPSGQALVDLY